MLVLPFREVQVQECYYKIIGVFVKIYRVEGKGKKEISRSNKNNIINVTNKFDKIFSHLIFLHVAQNSRVN